MVELPVEAPDGGRVFVREVGERGKDIGFDEARLGLFLNP
jgi:hypothetical protein